jgi:Ni,Fe-hydrogenase III component G
MTSTHPPISELDTGKLAAAVENQFGTALSLSEHVEGADVLLGVNRSTVLPALAKFLFWEAHGSFGGIVVEEGSRDWSLRYLFLLRQAGWVHVVLPVPLEARTVPSIVAEVHAADWYEREAEDLFGLSFEGHPKLGDFILHNETWQENIAPMRKAFPAGQQFQRKPDRKWRPTLVVGDPGSFAMPVGPVYEGGLGESIHFLLETVGEDVIRAIPRLFYKYRAVEKIAVGKTVAETLLLPSASRRPRLLLTRWHFVRRSKTPRKWKSHDVPAASESFCASWSA